MSKQNQTAFNAEDSRMHNAQNAGQNLSANSTMQIKMQGNAGNLTPQEYAKLEEFVKLAFDFARSDDAPSLKIMLENGLNPNLANHKGDTLLMLASYHNALNCVRLLLDFGANVDTPNDRGHTPLAGVCFKGYVEMAKLLLESGANPNGYDENSATNGANDSKNTPQASAKNDSMPQASASDSKDIARSSAILSPINTAIMFRRKEILTLLLRYNAKKLPLWKRLFAKLTGLQ